MFTVIDFSISECLYHTDKFINYITSLKKYKSGGYYTYNSRYLEAFLNYEIQNLIDNGIVQIRPAGQ